MMLARGSRRLPQVKSCLCQGTRFEPAWRRKDQWGPARNLSGTTPAAKKETPDFAFAFDIDGVLLRSAVPIPGASQSLTYLQDHHIPFILLTNGGGKHESERVADISNALALPTPLTTKNFIQSHTPFADFLNSSLHHPTNASLSPESTVLVIGGEAAECRHVAESYGFKTVITPGDILAAHPEIWPFSRVFSTYYSSFAKPLPRPINRTSTSSSLKIDAIFVFHDPRDWALDIQLILDILLSDSGILGTTSPRNGDQNLPNNGYQQQNQPPLYFSNPDLLWAAKYHLPRLGQGGFQHALEGVWRRLTDGAELQCTVIGKPSSLTYSFAEKRLKAYRGHLIRQNQTQYHSREDGTDMGKEKDSIPPLKKVYMVGDNPESDIMGANNYTSKQGNATEWVSVLVKTGVYTDGDGERRYDFEARPELKPKIVVEDVNEAVQWGLRDMGW